MFKKENHTDVYSVHGVGKILSDSFLLLVWIVYLFLGLLPGVSFDTVSKSTYLSSNAVIVAPASDHHYPEIPVFINCELEDSSDETLEEEDNADKYAKSTSIISILPNACLQDISSTHFTPITRVVKSVSLVILYHSWKSYLS